jgi:NadR type nicotinamide-nucleotide adenylyltransferase
MSFARPKQEMVKKVCVTGPECTGKSELSEFLAGHFKTSWAPEYARAYLSKLNHPYQQSDLTKIAHGQVRLEEEWASLANRVLICDTNLITIKIWSEFKYGDCDDDILRLIQQRQYDLYLLCYIDVPWQEDPQREHPQKREELWTIYKKELEKSHLPFIEIRGPRETRRAVAINSIETLIS